MIPGGSNIFPLQSFQDKPFKADEKRGLNLQWELWITERKYLHLKEAGSLVFPNYGLKQADASQSWVAVTILSSVMG